jgi:hypothetical protein
VHNVSDDCLLVEQLYTEIDEFDLLRHIQALRSLACIPPPSSSAATSSTAADTSIGVGVDGMPMGAARGGGGAAAVGTGVKNPQIQLRALSDCLLGMSPSPSLAFERASSGAAGTVLLTSPHTSYVRAEAAFAIAQWQNERAPKTGYVDTPGSWPGLAVLLAALRDMFIDPISNLPLPNDFTNESSTYLRTSLLLALSTVRAQSGVTPPAVAKTLLFFAENNLSLPSIVISESTTTAAGGGGGGGNDDAIAAASGAAADATTTGATSGGTNPGSSGSSSSSSGGVDANSLEAQQKRSTTSSSTSFTSTVGPIYDDGHYKAALLLALSRVRVEPQSHHHHHGSDSGSHSHTARGSFHSNSSSNSMTYKAGSSGDVLSKITSIAKLILQSELVSENPN